MSQSRLMSLVETVTNIVIGLVISLISQIIIFNAYGINLPINDNVAIVLWFTLISVIRSYTIRRLFNRRVKG